MAYDAGVAGVLHLYGRGSSREDNLMSASAELYITIDTDGVDSRSKIDVKVAVGEWFIQKGVSV